jgi:5-methylcytosine-specific restriction endonuclease McrA
MPMITQEMFLKRTADAYRGMVRRTSGKKDKAGRSYGLRAQLPFTLVEFRRWWLDQFGIREIADVAINMMACPYCGKDIDVILAVPDHKVPLSRQGGLGLDNLMLCCWHCNCEKGEMTATAYIYLRRALEQLPERDRTDVKARLRNGAGYVRAIHQQHSRPDRKALAANGGH